MKCANCGCENPVYAVVCEQCGSFLPKEDMFVSKKESIPEVTEQTGLETISQGSSGVEQAGAEPISTEPADPKPISVEPTVVEPTFPAPTPAPEGKIRFGAVPYREHQVMYLAGDISKTVSDTGYAPKTAFRDGIGKTAEWIKKSSERGEK